MSTLLHILSQKFQTAILSAFPEWDPNTPLPLEISQSTQAQFGHYQCNSAMKLAKVLGAKPRDIATRIIEHVDVNLEGIRLIEKMEIAGPGFINITLDPAYLSQKLHRILLDSHLDIELPQHKQKIIVEFSSPNTAKELHVGHLRSTIIGDSLARLFEFLGHDVLRLNHIGDWGTAFGMLIAYMKQETPHVLDGTEKTDLQHLVQWYKKSKERFDSDADFKKTSQLEVVALQGGDPAALKAWEIICDISRKAYQEIYDLLDVKIIERGESYYNPMLADTVADLEAKGLVTLSDGAKCIFLEGFQNREGASLPLMVQKSDGGYNYDTTDMAAIRQRTLEEKADRIIYVTDAGQSLHFQMIFQAAEKAHYLDASKVRVDHVPFGLVLGSDGKKFRTRSGETERLIDLLLAAVKHADQLLIERSPEMPKEEREKLAKTLGIAAVKYADLACNRTGDYTFSYERMLRFEGNTAAFLMYAYVRVAGIKRKINPALKIEELKDPIVLEHPSEISLAVHLAQFEEALEQVASDLLPNRLTEYLYGLAEKFNAFFRDCRVEGSPQQNSRLQICEIVAKTMKQGLSILGVQTVERM
ncbi:arginine--tRNA ligase [Parachlamydia acanthamoebae]|jgi:arginyl-tRNA synthetase|uniref:arginine--tRNA ligase n=1 Tax=Parachlamydia acanthamoebae TaxID=83552 RepID=UPI000750FB01|nr:arginine--tRNA ligase [Parachlamydia acanthamoebae]